MFTPTILKNVDLPDMLLPVSTIPFLFKCMVFATGSSSNGCTPFTIFIVISFLNTGFDIYYSLASLNPPIDI